MIESRGVLLFGGHTSLKVHQGVFQGLQGYIREGIVSG